MNEIWKPIKGFNYYEISNFGRVRSHRFNKTLILKNGKDGGGYPMIWIYKSKKPHPKLIHRLMCESFFGKCPKGKTVGHLDGDKENNNILNLKYVTPKENASHKKLHKTQQVGEDVHFSKLTKSNVLSIRKAIKNNPRISRNMLASKFGVSRSQIWYISSRKSWSWL